MRQAADQAYRFVYSKSVAVIESEANGCFPFVFAVSRLSLACGHVLDLVLFLSFHSGLPINWVDAMVIGKHSPQDEQKCEWRRHLNTRQGNVSIPALMISSTATLMLGKISIKSQHWRRVQTRSRHPASPAILDLRYCTLISVSLTCCPQCIGTSPPAASLWLEKENTNINAETAARS